ncbi:MAG: DUF1574 domain-containing protein [Candidatus Obscuribacterales bacterium]|nr:DUF1574 domain-containing protein [Candidatus Obscuribacterales bacterium]
MRAALTKLVKGLTHSRFAIALAVFWLLNAGLTLGRIGFAAPVDFPVLSWTGWTVKQFLEMKDRPEVVFLGSSLVLVPLDGVDADFLNRKIDGSQHHHSAYFENRWKELTGNAVRSYTFALPGEMPSDAFLIVKNLLTGQKKPDVIVYGVGPRDFLDNLLPSPSATDPYRYLSRFGPVDDIASRVMPDWQERMNYELGRVFSLYGNRDDLSAAAARMAGGAMIRVLPFGKNITYDERHVLIPDYHPCEVCAGQAFFRPTTPAERTTFADNLGEYKKRYANLKWNTYLTQLEFFADTLETARANGIKTVVVAMPITDLNRSLLSEKSWHAYRNGVLAMAKAKGATTVDLSESPLFARSDFMDTVHLHSGGGKRWLDVVSEKMAADSTVAKAMSRSSKSLATRGGHL